MNRKGKFGIPARKTLDADLIGTPESLLNFAEKSGLKICPLDVYGIAEKLGIHVTDDSSLQENISGILEKDENGKWTMRVNASHHPNRKRYTIAHELGHFCLHKHQEMFFEDQLFFRGLERTKTEWQANAFASAILMPENQFQAFLNQGICDVDKLAQEFEVSTLALRIRAQELGFSGHGLK
jgi:Predicted Zn peptidase